LYIYTLYIVSDKGCTFTDIDWEGTHVNSGPYDDANACNALCRIDAACTKWTYYAGICFLKDPSSVKKTGLARISGAYAADCGKELLLRRIIAILKGVTRNRDI
jgi:hypothetical protein